MTLLSCFRKSLKPKSKSWNSDSSSSSNATPALATSQAFPSSYDTITPAGPPPVYTPTAPESKTGEITSIPAINYPSNAIPRTFSNNLTTQPQTHRPPSISSFTSSNGPVLNDEDDKFAFLKDFDTVLLVDDSGSMSGPRWSETRDALKALLPIVTKRDNDGIDIYFLNHKSSDKGDAREGKAGTGYRNITSVRKVEAIFKEVRPSGRTPTARRLREIMKPYIEHLTAAKRRGEAAFEAVKPMNLLCVTDGIAEGNVEGVIVEVAEKLDALDAISEQVGCQFFQVGDDARAAEALRELDDGLKTAYSCRDMVDTTTFAKDANGNKTLDGEAMLKFVFGAVDKRRDRQRLPGSH